MRTDELDFNLPPELIAQVPPHDRPASRLLHYDVTHQHISHRIFSDLPALLCAGDLLVLNDAKVLPARIALRKITGGNVEGLFLSEESPGTWRVLLRDMGRARIGSVLTFASDASVELRLAEHVTEGEYRVTLHPPAPASDVLDRYGRMPLPPYIKRDKLHDDRDDLDRDRYQTTFAVAPGSVAAPTAGLHFTPDLLKQLHDAGIESTTITLHVGMGTFKPVITDTLDAHLMHTERYAISPATADAVNRAKAERRRVIAVGTTVARVLESQPTGRSIEAITSETSIFIRPPYTWKHVDGLITNFHLPRSTLIALVAALVRLDEQRRVYAEAIRERYRFFSYGDAMFIDGKHD